MIEISCKFLDFPENLEEDIRLKEVEILKKKNAKERKKQQREKQLEPIGRNEATDFYA